MKKASIEDFKEHWNTNYRHITLELSDREIQSYLDTIPTLEKACDLASDYLLASGDADVQE